MDCGKETQRLDQKNAIEFVQLKMSAEDGNGVKIEDGWSKTNKRRVNLLYAIGRFNDVVR
jgi:hypothetical protein